MYIDVKLDIQMDVRIDVMHGTSQTVVRFGGN